MRHWRRRDDESYVAECCFTRTTHLPTRHLKNWLPYEIPDSKYNTTQCMRQNWLRGTSICFIIWSYLLKDADMLTTRTSSAPQMAGWKSKIDNCSTTESELWRNTEPSAFQLQESMLKSDKIWWTYLVVNCHSTNFLNNPRIYDDTTHATMIFGHRACSGSPS